MLLPPMNPVAQLSIELERAALRAVQRTYQDLNGTFFRWKLAAPSFLLVDSRSRLGRWVSGGRVIELSRGLLTEHGWGAVVEVLKHEMAHQYVEEVLGVRDESSHGPEFRRVCAERGFDARAAGLPQASGDGNGPNQVLERIAKLLALAESSNEHEAQAAMSAAQRLMLKYNVEAVQNRTQSAYTYRHLGAPTGRISESQRLLAALLSEYFFVEVIWVPVWRALEGKRGSVMEACGTLESVELAEYVHHFLVQTAERLWREHKREHRVSSDAGRRSYLAGVMSGFRDKLARERKKSAGEGLVWVRDENLSAYLRGRHPSVRWGSYRSGTASESYARGREAGRGIVLHRGVKGSSGSEARALLPAGEKPRRLSTQLS